MATIIPRSPGPQVEQRATPDVRARSTIDLSPMRQAIGAAGKTATAYFAQAKEEADVTALMEARRQLSDWEASTFNPANPDGISAYQGKNSLEASGKLLPSLDSRISEIRQRLSPDQQGRFDAVSFSFRDSVQGRLTGYTDREYSAYQAHEQKAALDNIGQDAVSAGVAGDFNLADIRISEALGMANAAYRARGLGEEAIKASERGIVSSVRSQTVAGMMTRDPFAAQDYYDRYADQMTPGDRAATERVLYPYIEDQQGDLDVAWAIGGGTEVAHTPGQRGEPSPEIKSIISQAASEYGVPAEYLFALAEQESSFNPKVRNPEALDDGDHAEGLFQYRRTTAEGLGGFDRSDPQASARAAAREFRTRMDRHGPEFAIAAHFAGDGGAQAVVVRGRHADNPKTSRYISEVLGRARRWRGEGQLTAEGPATSEAEALARVQQLQDPRRRAVAERKVRSMWQIQQMRNSEMEQQMTAGIHMTIESADPNNDLPLRQLLSPEQYTFAAAQGLIPGFENRWKQRKTGEVEASSPETVLRFDELMYRAASGNPEANRTFLAFNPYDPTVTLSRADRKRYADAQVAMREQDPKKIQDVATEAEVNSIIKQYTVTTLGIPEKQIGARNERGQAAWKFNTDMRSWAEAFTARENRKPTYSEVLEQADLLTMQGQIQTPGWLWGTNTQEFRVGDLNIPPADLIQIQEALTRAGRPVTAENVSAVWRTTIAETTK